MSPSLILHLNTESGWRGGEAQTLFLATGLRSRGHRALVVCRPGSALLERAAAAGLETIPLGMRGELDPGAARRLAGVIRNAGADLLHYHTAHAVGLGTLATLFCGRRPAVASRRVSFPLRGGPLARLKYGFRVDRVIAVSEAIRQGLIARGLRSDRVVTIHSGVDPARFASGNRSRFRKSLPAEAASWPEKAFVIGCVGHLAAHKGVDLFLHAAAQVAREIPQARFVIIGRGEREAALRRLADRLGLLGRLVFSGFRDDMADVYAGLDVLALSSTSGEGSPAVLKEAMAAGTAVAAAALDGVQEIIEDGRHGLLTPPGNAPALARALAILANDDALRSRLAAAARARVGEFTVDRMVDKTLQVYRSIGGCP